MTANKKDLRVVGALPDGAGVYCITQISTGKVYIGSSERVKRRAYEHQRYLRSGSHGNVYLQRAWGAASEGDFVIALVSGFADSADARAAERRLIIECAACNPCRGFNLLTPNERETFGHSEETKAKLSALLVGHKRNAGRPLSDEHKAKISAAQKGRKKPAEVVERIASANRGKKPSPEAVAKRSAALQGLPKTDEWRRKVSDAAKRRGPPTWMIEAAKRANTGRKQSPESIAARLEGKRKAKALREQQGATS